MAKDIKSKIKLEGEAEFNRQLASINNGLKTSRSDMSALSAEFEENAKSTEALTAKQKILQNSYDQQRAKVDALNAQYEKAKKKLGENEARTQKYRQQLNFATSDLAKAKAALEENAEELNKSKSALRNAASGYANLINKLSEAKDNLDEFTEKHKKAGELLMIPVTPLAALASGAAKTSAAILTAGAAMGGALLTSIVGFARETADAAKAAQEAGKTLTETQKQWLEYSEQLDGLEYAAANAKRSISEILLPVLSDLSVEGAGFLNSFSRDMDAAAGNTEKQAKVLSDYIVKGATLIRDKLPEYIALGKELFAGLGEGLSESGPELLDMGLNLMLDLLNGIISFAPELASAGILLVEKLAQGIINESPDAAKAAVDLVVSLVSGIGQAAPTLIPAAASLVGQLLTALIEASPQLLMAGLELVFGIVQGLFSGLADLAGAADALISGFVDQFAGRYAAFFGVGEDVVRGIWEGISGTTEWIFDKISGWVGNVVDWIKEKLDINSPSGVVEREIGFWFARGIGTGWEKEMRNVNKLIADSINTSFNVPDISVRSRASIGRSYATSSGKIVNLYFYAKTITESEIDMIVDVVNRKLGDEM